VRSKVVESNAHRQACRGFSGHNQSAIEKTVCQAEYYQLVARLSTQAVFFQTVSEGIAGNIEQLSSLGLVAVGTGQGLADELVFELI
jgi:hypothetical protein